MKNRALTECITCSECMGSSAFRLQAAFNDDKINIVCDNCDTVVATVNKFSLNFDVSEGATPPSEKRRHKI